MPLTDNLKNRFVVLLGDNRIDAALLESQLDQQRYSVDWGKQRDEILMLIQTRVFNLILLAFNKNTLEIIKAIKNTGGINRTTPVIALMASEDVSQRKMLIDAGFDDCLAENNPEKQVIGVIEYWQAKNNSALNYIQLIQNKTKHNQRLTVTIFNKLFEELPLQIKTIKYALDCKQYAVISIN
jgi:CheY-like chemotaxis protein